MRFTSVMQDLKHWGPDSDHRPASLQEAQRYCQSVATGHYENFSVASWLLPRRLHQHFFNVYAFCRWADDLGDESSTPEQATQLLNWWETELNDCYDGQCWHPVFTALRPTIEEFGLPKSDFTALISAFLQDQRQKEYETFADLLDYCTRSANPVGRLVLRLFERLNPENAEASDSICTGLQLANFWQDVARDYEIGRIYLPSEDWSRFGVTRHHFETRQSSPEFRELLKFQVDRTAPFLENGRVLVKNLSGRLKFEIEVIRRGGLATLEGIRRVDYGVWEKRPKVSHKAVLLRALISAPLLYLHR